MQVVRSDAQAITDKYQAKVVETSAVTKLGIKEVFLEVTRLWNERPKEAEKVKKMVRKRSDGEGCACSVE
jgi:Fe2+ transport system protein B